MDPALKQRLLGAAVLVALAIIFLPMIFDGPAPPPPPAGSLPLTVPAAPDRKLQTREIPLALPSRTPAADSGPVPQVPTPVSAGNPPVAEGGDRLATVDVPAAPRSDLADEDLVPAPRTTAPASTPTAGQTATAAAPAATTASAPAPAGGAEVVPPGSRFVVNLGSYSNAANAQALLGRLKAGGVLAYSESIQVEGKAATRLRAGPFASRAAADSAALAVRRVQSDLPVAVIGLESSESAPARVALAVAGGFIVQVAAFRSEAEANALRDRLRNGGYTTFVERVARDNGALWRVRVGPEIQRAKANESLSSIKQRFGLDGQVLTYP